jgi:hypothetical protein
LLSKNRISTWLVWVLVVTRLKWNLGVKVVQSGGNWSCSYPCRRQNENQKRPPGSKKPQKVAIYRAPPPPAPPEKGPGSQALFREEREQRKTSLSFLPRKESPSAVRPRFDPSTFRLQGGVPIQLSCCAQMTTWSDHVSIYNSSPFIRVRERPLGPCWDVTVPYVVCHRSPRRWLKLYPETEIPKVDLPTIPSVNFY